MSVRSAVAIEADTIGIRLTGIAFTHLESPREYSRERAFRIFSRIAYSLLRPARVLSEIKKDARFRSPTSRKFLRSRRAAAGKSFAKKNMYTVVSRRHFRKSEVLRRAVARTSLYRLYLLISRSRDRHTLSARRIVHNTIHRDLLSSSSPLPLSFSPRTRMRRVYATASVRTYTEASISRPSHRCEDKSLYFDPSCPVRLNEYLYAQVRVRAIRSEIERMRSNAR